MAAWDEDDRALFNDERSRYGPGRPGELDNDSVGQAVVDQGYNTWSPSTPGGREPSQTLVTGNKGADTGYRADDLYEGNDDHPEALHGRYTGWHSHQVQEAGGALYHEHNGDGRHDNLIIRKPGDPGYGVPGRSGLLPEEGGHDTDDDDGPEPRGGYLGEPWMNGGPDGAGPALPDRNSDQLSPVPPYDWQPGAKTGKSTAVSYSETSSSSGRGPWTPRARTAFLSGEHEIDSLTKLAGSLEREMTQARSRGNEQLFYQLVGERDQLLQRRSQLEAEHEDFGRDPVAEADDLVAECDEGMHEARVRNDQAGFRQFRERYDWAVARRSELAGEGPRDGEGIAGPVMRSSALLGGHYEDDEVDGADEGYGRIATVPPSPQSRYSSPYSWSRDAHYSDDGLSRADRSR